MGRMGRRVGLGFAMLGAAVTLLAGAPRAAVAESLVHPIQYRDYQRGYDDRRDDRRGYDDRRGGYDDRRGGYDDRRGGGGGGAPGGTYMQSCGSVRMEGSTLVAVCKGNRNSRFETSLDVSRCGRSDIGNDYGTLQCSGARGRSRRVD